MANTEIFDRILWYFNCLLILTVYVAESKSVVYFESTDGDASSLSVLHHKVVRRDVTSKDEKCNSEKQKLQQLLGNNTIDSIYTFTNESKYSMALAWAGKNDGNLIIVTTEENNGEPTNSTVYRSTDFGRDYDIIQGIDEPIKKHNGLQRNPHDAKKVYLIGGKNVMYVTEDGGLKFTKVLLPFNLYDEIVFHSDESYNSYLLAKDTSRNLYASVDNGIHWKKVMNLAGKVYWGVMGTGQEETCDNPNTIYAATSPDSFLAAFGITTYTLRKSNDGGSTWKPILNNVVSYERQGGFLYASVLIDPNYVMSKRLLKISSDCGVTWHDAQLPTIEHDRFYRVMDVESNMIFLHVDDPTDSGHGTLYTSSTSGVVYSESLPRHLYPNYGDIHDFYKVKSLRGVYITSQMNSDDSIHTMISYNRGASWEKIKRPAGEPCKDESKECYLQIHGMYSIKRAINSSLPLSETAAVGIIMAHGHVADALQRTDPDVYVSSDGGYNWRLSLQGPHHYRIGDHGGLLVAIPRNTEEPKIIKYSTDEGRCWHEYTFTDKSLKFTGLLTEPEGKSLVVMIWGYLSDTRKWEVHVIDFKDVITRQCNDSDYEPWLAHQAHTTSSLENVGCILGMRETFLRLKKDSMCYNGYEHIKSSSIQNCTCTREDYECDYGYFRPGGSDKCVKIAEFKSPDVDICLRGHEEKLVSEGYRKVPGDVCSHGFAPSSKLIDLKKKCDEGSKIIVEEDEQGISPVGKMSKGVKVFAVIIVIIVLALSAVMGVYFIRKYILLRKHRVEYRYSMLNQNDDDSRRDNQDWNDDLDNALSSSTINYQDSDEEELTTSTVQPSKSRRTQPSRQNGVVKTKDTNPFGSYHDDSDDDLLS